MAKWLDRVKGEIQRERERHRIERNPQFDVDMRRLAGLHNAIEGMPPLQAVQFIDRFNQVTGMGVDPAHMTRYDGTPLVSAEQLEGMRGWRPNAKTPDELSADRERWLAKLAGRDQEGAQRG